VCGCDGITYTSAIDARNAGVRNYTFGPCNMEFNCQNTEPISNPRYKVERNHDNGIINVSAEFEFDPCCPYFFISILLFK
jgi:hypothetical protein